MSPRLLLVSVYGAHLGKEEGSSMLAVFQRYDPHAPAAVGQLDEPAVFVLSTEA